MTTTAVETADQTATGVDLEGQTISIARYGLGIFITIGEDTDEIYCTDEDEARATFADLVTETVVSDVPDDMLRRADELHTGTTGGGKRFLYVRCGAIVGTNVGTDSTGTTFDTTEQARAAVARLLDGTSYVEDADQTATGDGPAGERITITRRGTTVVIETDEDPGDPTAHHGSGDVGMETEDDAREEFARLVTTTLVSDVPGDMLRRADEVHTGTTGGGKRFLFIRCGATVGTTDSTGTTDRTFDTAGQARAAVARLLVIYRP